MAEDKNKIKRSSGGGLFSGPADPFGAGLGRGKRPGRPKKASKPPSRTSSMPPAAKKAEPPKPAPAVDPVVESAPQAPSVPEPEQATAPAPPKPTAPRPGGIPLGGQSAPAKPELSQLPASMRLRIAKAEHEKEMVRRTQEQEPRPAVELAPADTEETPLPSDGRRITLPPVSERGTAPSRDTGQSESFDLLGDDEDFGAPGGLMDLVQDEPSEHMAPEEPEFPESPGRVVASLEIHDALRAHSHSDRSSLEEVDASAWADPQTDHDALFDISARARNEEDVLDPPSDVMTDLGDLPRGGPVVVRKGKGADFKRVSPRPMVEDSGVWKPEPITPAAPEPSSPRQSAAWWEKKEPAAPASEPLSQRIAPLPEPAPAAPKRPAPPSFVGKTRQEREATQRRKVAMFGGIGALLVLALVGVIVWMSQTPGSETPVHTPAKVAPSAGDLPPPTTAPLSTTPPPIEPLPDPIPEPDPLPEALPEPPLPEPVEPTQPVVEQPSLNAAEPGFLNIRAEPRAVIFLGRKNLGETPIERLELEPGSYTLKAVAPGKRAKTRTVRVDSGRAQQIVFRW